MPHYTLEGKVNEETLRVVFSCIKFFQSLNPNLFQRLRITLFTQGESSSKYSTQARKKIKELTKTRV